MARSKPIVNVQAFDANLPLAQVILSIADTRSMTQEQREKFIALFNQYGFVVVEHAPYDNPEEQLVALGSILGTINQHDRSNVKGIVSMSPDEKVKGYLGATSKKHPLHTDGAYDEEPPNLLCLQCIQHAESGGDSIVVSGKAIYDWLAAEHPVSLKALFSPDAMTVSRVGREGTQAIFKKMGDMVTLVWRDDFTTTFADRPEVTQAVELVRAFINNPTNRLIFKLMPNQILVGNNLGVLHGRTAFDADEKRKLNRMNNNGDSEFCENLVFGFNA